MSQDLHSAIGDFRRILEAASRSNGGDGREAVLSGLLLSLNQTLVDLVVALEKRERSVIEIEMPGPTGAPVKAIMRRVQ